MNRFAAAKVLALVALAASLGCSKAPAADRASEPTSGFVEVTPHKADGSLVEVLASHAKQAKTRGLVPYAELGATWCKPCRELEASMADPRMKAAFEGTYIVHLDIDEWGSSLKKSGLATASVPTVVALDGNGKGTARTIDGAAWDENVPENMAPKLGTFFRAGR